MERISLQSIPSERPRRWQLLRELTAEWYRPLEPTDGYPDPELREAAARLEVALPTALREFYEFAARRSDIWCQQDRLLNPSELQFQSGYLPILRENQNVVEWGISRDALQHEDPPVSVASDYRTDPWKRINESFSQFVLQLFLYNLKFAQMTWANGFSRTPTLDKLKDRCIVVPLPEWPWPAPSTFFQAEGALIEFQRTSEEEGWIYVTTQGPEPASELTERLQLDVDWEAQSEDWPQPM